MEHKNGTFTVLKSKPRIVIPSDASADPVMHVSKDGTVSGTGEKQIDMTTIVAVAVGVLHDPAVTNPLWRPHLVTKAGNVPSVLYSVPDGGANVAEVKELMFESPWKCDENDKQKLDVKSAIALVNAHWSPWGTALPVAFVSAPGLPALSDARDKILEAQAVCGAGTLAASTRSNILSILKVVTTPASDPIIRVGVLAPFVAGWIGELGHADDITIILATLGESAPNSADVTAEAMALRSAQGP